MLLHLYNQETKEYEGSIPACLDPMASRREGKPVYAILQNSTLVEPKIEDGKIPIFNGKGWDLVSDYRGKTVYKDDTGIPLVITKVGEIPIGYSLEKPVFFQDLKIEKIKEIEASYNCEVLKEIEVKKIKVKVSDRPYLYLKLEESEKVKYAILNLEDRVIGKVVKFEDLNYIVNFLYLREILLSIKKNELIKEVNKCKCEKDLSNVIVDFDVSSRIKRHVEKPLEDIEKYIAKILKEE